ncbi:MAG: UDP-N-acetylmuramoyl-tripeptide--D-alanyl-D-alanine ligase [Nitrospinota bacterium]|nr:UDP-N-acetylmuramoyl-tripeptide--D-alanyl-D-alanine ligase [Nitrospinota bacterium]
MPRMTVEEVKAATDGVIVKRGRRRTIEGISIDSRTTGPGELFIPVIGERRDAHRFIPQALERGAAAILAQGDRIGAQAPGWGANASIITVEDTTRALGDLAAFHRGRFHLHLAAVTGSSGKTSTKDMTAAVLSRKWRVHKSEGNLNNFFGLPLSLFRMDRGHQASVVELGMNRAGEIRRLAEIARPSVGVITNIGPVHLEFLKTVAGVRDAKAEMAQVMAERGRGVMVLNAENPHCLNVAERYGRDLEGRIVLFGRLAAAHVQAADVRSLGKAGMAFTLRMGTERRAVRLRTPGEHNVANALAAAAAAWSLGVGADDVASGLEDFRPAPMRMEVLDLPEGLHVVNDAYNANPDSMAAALTTFAGLTNGGRSVAVLGDMLELGRRAAAAHRSVGAAVARMAQQPSGRIDHLLVLGKRARLMADEALKRGMNRRRVTVCETHAEAARWLKRHTRSGDWVLLKGSRGMGMERVLEGLRPAGRGGRLPGKEGSGEIRRGKNPLQRKKRST